MSESFPDNVRDPVDIRRRGGILLVSNYELGHQPLGLVVPAAVLEQAGFTPALLDTSVETFDEEKVAAAALVGISVPMHTALRLGIRAAERVRAINPGCHIVFYGTYAGLNSEHLLGTVADSCLGAEFEEALVGLARAIEGGTGSGFAGEPSRDRSRLRTTLPLRDDLPPLDRYAKLRRNGATHRVGYVASTRGCKHTCLHCPIPAVYDNRFSAVPLDTVLADVGQLVAATAEHITFADPDFLNGPSHAIRIGRAIHDLFPNITFDYTAKIEHLLKHRNVVERLAEFGCVFVVSAVESFSDRTLVALNKGHTRRDAVEVMRFFRRIGLALRPTFMPFTPWDTLDDYRDLLDVVEAQDLIDYIDPIQYSIRLLIPPGSLLLGRDSIQPYLGPLDETALSYRWRHPDPRMDQLYKDVARLVEKATEADEDAAVTFFRIKRLAGETASPELDESAVAAILRRYPAGRPRPPQLTEDWFC